MLSDKKKDVRKKGLSVDKFIIESLERRQMMDGAPGDIVLPGGIEQPEAVIEAPAVIGVWAAVAT